jgi:hypothetical protein
MATDRVKMAIKGSQFFTVVPPGFRFEVGG